MGKETTAWLFPGQGSQSVGMGADLPAAHPVARETLEEADDLLGYSLSRLMFEGPKERLDETIHTQPALFTHSLALVRAGRAAGTLPEAGWAAGHSLGEYSALAAAGALTFADGLRLVQERARLMTEAGRREPGGMAAILALDEAEVAALCADASRPGEQVQVANDNCPGQLVVSGHLPAVQRVGAAATEAGARKVIPLDVSIASHSPLMGHAREAFAEVVALTPIHPPAIPVIGNVSGRPLTTPAEIREELVAQLTEAVRWTASMRYLVARGVERFIEIGAGTVLSGLMKRIERGAERENIAVWEALPRNDAGAQGASK